MLGRQTFDCPKDTLESDKSSAMPGTRIAVEIRGTPTDDEDVRFGNFIKQLTAIRKALTETERIVSYNVSKVSVDYRVVDLRHNSPSLVVLEEIPLSVVEDEISDILTLDVLPDSVYQPGQVTDIFFRGIRDVTQGTAPPEFDYYALQAFKEMAGLLSKGDDISSVTIHYEDSSVDLLPSLPQVIDRILGPDVFESGSITGKIERLNIHAGQNVFTVYPTSKKPPLRCLFRKQLRNDVVAAVGKYVRVYGRLKYKLRDTNPYEMLAHEIELYPDESNLPSLSDLWGIAPNITGGKSSEDFIRDMRDEWQ
jgi:hypothetical protein